MQKVLDRGVTYVGCRVKAISADSAASILLRPFIKKNTCAVSLHHDFQIKAYTCTILFIVGDRSPSRMSSADQDLVSVLVRFCADVFAWETLYKVWQSHLHVATN